MTERDEDEHETPDFVGLLAGELSRNQTVAAARHLEGCAVCAHKLADLVVAHAALRSSSRVGRLLDEDVEMATVHDDEPGAAGGLAGSRHAQGKRESQGRGACRCGASGRPGW